MVVIYSLRTVLFTIQSIEYITNVPTYYKYYEKNTNKITYFYVLLIIIKMLYDYTSTFYLYVQVNVFDKNIIIIHNIEVKHLIILMYLLLLSTVQFIY